MSEMQTGGFGMQLMGDAELIRKFQKLPVKIQKKHGWNAMLKAGRRVARAAKKRVPKKTGQLKKSLGVKRKLYRKSGTIVAIVGPRTGHRTTVNGKPHDPAKIAHLVEMGHSGPHPAGAKPFLRPAMDETAKSNVQLIASELAKGLTEEATK